MTSMFDPPKPSRLAPKPVPPKPPAKLPADVTLRDANHYCDYCGYAHDGSGIAFARFKIGTPKGSLYLCNHHFNQFTILIIANKYVVTELGANG
jgi:hypothetical protein